MSEILTLAETFKRKSSKQAELIEEELNTVMTTLNTSMTKSLQESANIIKTGTADLNEQNRGLLQMLKQHEQDTHTVLTSYTSKVQAHLGKGLSEHTEQMQTAIEGYTTTIQTMIESHTESVQTMIENKQDEITQGIKSDMSNWAIIAGVATFVILILGLMMGIGIAKKVIDPTVIYYQEQPKNQPYVPYNP